MRMLSSSWTFFYKLVFPTVWIGGFVLVTFLMFVAPDSFEGDGDVREVRWPFVAVTVGGTALLYWACVRLKRVSLEGNDLVVSNYRETIRVPLREVEEVSGSILMNPELVWVRFRRPTRFGSKIVLMPKFRFSLGFSRHPLVDELRSLISDPAVQG